MCFQVIDRKQRLMVGQRDRLRGGQADDQAADQARAGSGGDAVQIAKRHLRFSHRLADDVIERLHMGACGDFRHHAAERRMLVDLGQHHIGQNRALRLAGPLDQGRGGLIAGRLDA